MDELSYSIIKDEGYEITNDICSNTSNNELKFYIPIKDKINFYFYYDSLFYKSKDGNVALINYIKVNDKKIYNSLVNNEKNEKFFDINGFINLGLYKNETIEITISLSKNVCIENFKFVGLDINKLNNFINGYKSNVIIRQDNNKLIVNVNSDSDDKSLFLPLNYLNGYECELNGRKVSINKVLDNFVSINLDKGNNKIILTYYPPYFKISSVI